MRHPRTPPDDPDSGDDLDATKVDVDPNLFGEFPDEPIEVVPDEYVGLDAPRQQHRWQRQMCLVSMLDACVRCDGPIEEREMSAPNEDTIVKRKCKHCGEAWIMNSSSGYTSNRSL